MRWRGLILLAIYSRVFGRVDSTQQGPTLLTLNSVRSINCSDLSDHSATTRVWATFYNKEEITVVTFFSDIPGDASIDDFPMSGSLTASPYSLKSTRQPLRLTLQNSKQRSERATPLNSVRVHRVSRSTNRSRSDPRNGDQCNVHAWVRFIRACVSCRRRPTWER